MPDGERPPSAEPQVTPAPPPRRLRALVYRAIGVTAVAVGAAGVFLPLLPTTPFLLIALWAFARGSPELAERLRAHPRYGPILRDWEERRAIPRKAKAAAVGLMALSWTGLTLATHNALASAGVGAVLLVVAGWIVTRPSA